MSLDYDLRIVTDWEPILILEFLSKKLQLGWEEGVRLFGPGIVLGVSRENERRQAFIQSMFGFAPTVDVWFWLDKNEDYYLGKQTLLQAVMLLLSEMPGDAVLLINYETIVLQRIGGTLIFNQELGTWSNEELASVKLPYYQQPLRSPIISEELPKVELDNGIYIHLHSLAVSQGKDVRELVRDAIGAYLQSQAKKPEGDLNNSKLKIPNSKLGQSHQNKDLGGSPYAM
ncbi:MAG: SitI3 family protein [Hormoscilla sp.]